MPKRQSEGDLELLTDCARLIAKLATHLAVRKAALEYEPLHLDPQFHIEDRRFRALLDQMEKAKESGPGHAQEMYASLKALLTTAGDLVR